jgi:hypothetical protein
LGQVILSDHKERRISTFVVNSATNPEILRCYALQDDMFIESSTGPNKIGGDDMNRTIKDAIRAPFLIVILTSLILLILSAMVVQAQGDDDDGRPRLRVVNASLGIPKADVYVNDTLFFSSVFYSYISNYVPVDQTNVRLRVRPAGVKDVDPLTEREWNFEGGKDYTMVIVGTEENLETPWVFEDDNKAEIRPGRARVRMVHASRKAPAVEICLNNQCQTLTYPRVSDEYLTVEAGTYKLNIRLIGAKEAYFDVLPISFEAGQVYSLFILDPHQGETRPRIIPHNDTGRLLPQPPGDIGQPCPSPCEGHPSPYGPGDPGPAPLYPPVTGRFLTPTMVVMIAGVVMGVIGGVWIIRRQLIKT